MVLVWTFDANYLEPAVVSISSALRCLKQGERALVAVISGGILREHRDRFHSWFNRSHPFHSLRWVEGPNIDLRAEGGHVTPTAYLRLLLPELLPDIDKVLYLDPDTIIFGDISQLFDIELSSYPIGAVQDPLVPFVSSEGGIVAWQARGLAPDAPYFNSGVLLMDLSVLRLSGAGKALYDLAVEMSRESRYWDQDVLNVFFSKRWLSLPPKYNRPHMFIKEIDSEVCVLHYLGPLKPWLHGIGIPFVFQYYIALLRSRWYPWGGFATQVLKRVRHTLFRRTRNHD